MTSVGWQLVHPRGKEVSIALRSVPRILCQVDFSSPPLASPSPIFSFFSPCIGRTVEVYKRDQINNWLGAQVEPESPFDPWEPCATIYGDGSLYLEDRKWGTLDTFGSDESSTKVTMYRNLKVLFVLQAATVWNPTVDKFTEKKRTTKRRKKNLNRMRLYVRLSTDRTNDVWQTKRGTEVKDECFVLITLVRPKRPSSRTNCWAN